MKVLKLQWAVLFLEVLTKLTADYIWPYIPTLGGINPASRNTGRNLGDWDMSFNTCIKQM